jgi:hypothetical protein
MSRRLIAPIAAMMLAGLLWGPVRALALDCTGGEHLCPHPLGPGGVCVPTDWECCGTPICAGACGAAWKRCLLGGTYDAVCEDTAAMCTPQHGGDPTLPKFCEELIMVTGSLTCGQNPSIAGNIGWCCAADQQCGEHFPECICPTACGNSCCQGEQVCIEGFCKPPCPPGMHYEAQVCVCDDGQACGVGTRRTCCPAGATCQGSRCVTPREPDNPDSNPIQNFVNMINQVAGSHGGRSAPIRVPQGIPSGALGPALLQIAAVNGLRAAASLTFTDQPVDAAYQSTVVAADATPPALTLVDAKTAAALDALLAAQAKGFAQALASAKSIARARGALRARDLKQSRRHVGAGARFAGRAAKALRRVPKLRAKAVDALTSAGVPDVNVSADEVAALQASVEASGVPADLAAQLTALGADAEDLERVRRSLLTPSSGGPALIAPLADAAETDTLKSFAKALARFANSARRSPFGTVPGLAIGQGASR